MPDLNARDVRSLYEELRGLASGRNSEYEAARARYRGDHWNEADIPAGVTRYTLVANYIRPAVKGAVRDLFGRMPGVQVFPEGADEEARRRAEGAEGVIYRCYEDNEAAKVFRRAAHNQVLLRRGLLYVWWDVNEKKVRFRSVDPSNFYALKDGERIIECLLVSRRLTSELRRQHPGVRPDEEFATGTGGLSSVDALAVAYTKQGGGDVLGVIDALGDGGSSDDPTRGVPAQYTTVLDYFHIDGTWMRVASDQVLAKANLGYGVREVPFIEIENDFPGDEDEPESEVPEDVYDLNQYLNVLLSQQADIIRKYSNPTIVDRGTGVDPQKIKMTVQGEGAILPIRKDGELHFLNWEGPQPAISEQREAVKAMLHDLLGRPAAAFGQTVTNQSGVMTNLAMNPTVAVAGDRQVLWGMALVKLNEWILRLYEKFAASQDLSYRGYVPSGPRLGRMRYLDTRTAGADNGAFKGRDIGGWYRNQIKWPSVLRTDDPMYVQSIISQVTSDPPLLSVYDAIEMLGHDDAEGLADRIAAQLEDPRFHPDRMKSAIEAAGAMSGMDLGGGMPGDGLVPPDALDPSMMAETAQSAGNPNRDILAGG